MNINKVLTKFNYKEVGHNKWKAICPNHNDSKPSLSIAYKNGKIVMHCHAGCRTEDILSRVGLSLSDLFPYNVKNVGDDTSNSMQHRNGNCSLEDYSKLKRIPIEYLKSLGLRDSKYSGNTSLAIPYMDHNGQETATRYRTALEGENRFKWKQGAKTILYGLWRSKNALEKEYVILVEGESDCHTLWFHGFPALGLPGASTWNQQRDADNFKDIKTIYLILEPDQGGESIKQALINSSLLNKVKVLNLRKYKDPSELYCANPKKFKKRMNNAMKKSIPLSKVLSKEATKERKEAWSICKDLACCENILDRFDEDLDRLSVVGERKLAKTIYLALCTRFFKIPVSVVVKGSSSTGKSYVEENVLSFFPARAYYKLTAASEKAMIFSQESFKNRFIIFFEAAGIRQGFQEYVIRSLISEGCIKYEITEADKDGKQNTRRIEKEGPTGLITTTTKVKLHNENETRYLPFNTDDSPEQTRKVLSCLATERAKKGIQETVDMPKWHAFQVWLENKNHDVRIPYAETLSELINSNAPRVRRDFTKVLNLIEAHAIIHQKNRKTKGGFIMAEIKDYEAVYKLVSHAISTGLDSVVPGSIKRIVKTVKKLKKNRKKSNYPVSVTKLAQELDLDKSTVSRHVESAVLSGYLQNEVEKMGIAAKLILGDPLPLEEEVLPTSKRLRSKYLAKKKSRKAEL